MLVSIYCYIEIPYLRAYFASDESMYLLLSLSFLFFGQSEYIYIYKKY